MARHSLHQTDFVSDSRPVRRGPRFSQSPHEEGFLRPVRRGPRFSQSPHEEGFLRPVRRGPRFSQSPHEEGFLRPVRRGPRFSQSPHEEGFLRPVRRGPRFFQSPQEEGFLRPVRRGPRLHSPRFYPPEEDLIQDLVSVDPPYLLVIPPQNSGNVVDGRRPTHQDQTTYQDMRHVEASLYYYDLNPSAPRVGRNGGRAMYGFTAFQPNRTQNTVASAFASHGGGLSQEVIMKHLKTKKCPTRGTLEEEAAADVCVICQENISPESEMIGVLQCKHEYHVGCITQWLRQKNICPLCKATGLDVID